MQIHGKSIDSLVVKILQWHGGVICACHCMVGDRGIWLPEIGLCINTSTMADGAAGSAPIVFIIRRRRRYGEQQRHPPAAIAHERPSRVAKISSAPLTLPLPSSPAHLLLASLSRAVVLLVAAIPATATRRLVPARVLPPVCHSIASRRRGSCTTTACGSSRGDSTGAAGGAVERAGARLRVGGVRRAPREGGGAGAGEGGAGRRGERFERVGGGKGEEEEGGEQHLERGAGEGERRLECTVAVVDEGRPKACAGRDARKKKTRRTNAGERRPASSAAASRVPVTSTA